MFWNILFKCFRLFFVQERDGSWKAEAKVSPEVVCVDLSDDEEQQTEE